MKKIKDELQHIIFSNGPLGQADNLKKTQNFLRGYAKTGFDAKKQQQLKIEEASALIYFAQKEGLFYSKEILEEQFISAGAEQRVYQYDELSIIKTNGSIFMNIGSIILIAYLYTIISFLPQSMISLDLNLWKTICMLL